MGHCLYCNHCLPCPAGINIGQVNKLLHSLDGETPANWTAAHAQYAALPVKASACIRCGQCEARCPFDVPVRNAMDQAVQAFEHLI